MTKKAICFIFLFLCTNILPVHNVYSINNVISVFLVVFLVLGAFLFLFVLNYNCSVCNIKLHISHWILYIFDVPWNYIFSISINERYPIILVIRNKTIVTLWMYSWKCYWILGEVFLFFFSSYPLWYSLKYYSFYF